MLHSAQEVYNYSGIYISYSLSSSSNALKVEPYLITPADSNDHVKVVHMSAYNTTHFGTAVFNNHQNAYIFFNEREAPQLALFTIYLQLPMYDFPHLLKGLYLCLDYNRNPIARRILFIKDGGLYRELLRGEQDRRSFFSRILEVVSTLGGDGADVL
mgnify:CR=1 FL=1